MAGGTRGLWPYNGPPQYGNIPWGLVNGSGTLAQRPAPSPRNVGFLYFAADVNSGTLYRSTGSAWVQLAAAVLVPNAQLTPMATKTLKGNNTGGTAAPVDVTLAQLLTMLGMGDGQSLVAVNGVPTGYLPPVYPMTGRLYLASAIPVDSADEIDKTTLYYGNTYQNDLTVTLYDGTRWKRYQFGAQLSLVPTLTSGKNYDVYLYDNAGTLTLELSAAWTNDSTRSDALFYQDGVPVKTTDKTRRYVGTIRANANGKMEDSAANRFVWNLYNRVPRKLKMVDTTTSWTQAGGAGFSWNSWNNSTSNRVAFIVGIQIEPVHLTFAGTGTISAGNVFSVGIGLDSTSTNSAAVVSPAFGSSTSFALYDDSPAAGYHYLQLLQLSSASNLTVTYYGIVFGGDSNYFQSGAEGWVWG